MTIDVEHWRAVITAAASRPKAKKLLGCSFKELKDFRALHMPDHTWPDPRQPEDIAREQFEARQRARLRQAQLNDGDSYREYIAQLSAEPTPEQVAEAAAELPYDLAKVLVEFEPGTRTRELANEYSRLATLRLVYPLTVLTQRKSDGYAITALGRAVQVYLQKAS